jgi:PAS domain-containing protein
MDVERRRPIVAREVDAKERPTYEELLACVAPLEELQRQHSLDRQWLVALTNNLPVGVWITDLRGRMLLINESLEKLEEVLGTVATRVEAQ